MRATLNLGHTFGHALETTLGYGTLLHGEAVAVGTAMAADLSVKLGWITPELQARATRLLLRASLPTALPEAHGLSAEDLEQAMSLDKKVANGVLRLILLKGELGGCVFTGDYDRDMLRKTLEQFTEERPPTNMRENAASDDHSAE